MLIPGDPESNVDTAEGSLWPAVALAFAPAAALGLARFGYALILPAMKSDLHWSYFEAGTLNTANAAGYIVGAVVASAIGRRFGLRRTLLWSLAAIVLSVFLCAASTSVYWLSALRVVAGVAGGAVYVVGGGLAAALGGLSAKRASRSLSIYFGGVGGGILCSGLLVPEAVRSSGWRQGWILLGAATVVGLLVVTIAFKRFDVYRSVQAQPQRRLQRNQLKRLRPTTVAYFLHGVGYIAYMTFVVALIHAEGASTRDTVLFWSVLGVGAMLSAPFFAPAFTHRRLRGGRGLALGVTCVCVATVLPVLSGNLAVVLVSAGVFGGSFIAVAAIVAVIARESLPAESVTAALGRLTVVFAVGQVLGPLLAGSISDSHAGLRLGLAASAIVLAVAVPVALRQRAAENVAQ